MQLPTSNQPAGGHALLYARVSSPEQAARGASLAAQFAVCRRYADQLGWAECSEFWDVVSGMRDDRRGYIELVERVRQLSATGQPVVVITAALDRLGRRLLESVRVHAELRALGVAIHSVREGGALPDLLVNILSAIAEEEVQRIARRIAAVRERQVAQGWYVSNRLPWGYRWRPATAAERAELAPRRVPEVDPLVAPQVQVMFDGAARGVLLKTLVATPSQTQTEMERRAQWLGHVLRTPTYVGRPWKGDADVLSRPRGRWPALIDDATWEQLGERFARRSYSQGNHLLLGFLCCGQCGRRADRLPEQVGKQARLTCTARAHGHPSLGTEPALNGLVLRPIRSLVSWLATTAARSPGELARVWQDVQQPTIQQAAAARYEAERDLAQRRLRSAGGLLAAGDLDPDGYELVREQVDADLVHARVGARRPPALPGFEALLCNVREWTCALDSCSTAQHRQVLALLVRKVYSHREGFGRHRIEIVWTLLGDGLQQCRRDLRRRAA